MVLASSSLKYSAHDHFKEGLQGTTSGQVTEVCTPAHIRHQTSATVFLTDSHWYFSFQETEIMREIIQNGPVQGNIRWNVVFGYEFL